MRGAEGTKPQTPSGNKGGKLMAIGTPEQVAATKDSITGKYLKPLLEAKPLAAKPAKETKDAKGKKKKVA